MIPIQPWMIKGGAVVLFLSAVFTGGCQAQKKIDLAKIQRLESKIARCTEINVTLTENVTTLKQGIKDRNEQIADLGRQYDKKVAAIEKANKENLTQLNKRNTAVLRNKEREAADLRARMVGLSAAEACHEAWLEVAQ